VNLFIFSGVILLCLSLPTQLGWAWLCLAEIGEMSCLFSAVRMEVIFLTSQVFYSSRGQSSCPGKALEGAFLVTTELQLSLRELQSAFQSMMVVLLLLSAQSKQHVTAQRPTVCGTEGPVRGVSALPRRERQQVAGARGAER